MNRFLFKPPRYHLQACTKNSLTKSHVEELEDTSIVFISLRVMDLCCLCLLQIWCTCLCRLKAHTHSKISECFVWHDFKMREVQVVPFPICELQSRWVAMALSGRVALPPVEEMMQSVEAFYAKLEASGKSKRLAHNLSTTQVGSSSFTKTSKLLDYCIACSLSLWMFSKLLYEMHLLCSFWGMHWHQSYPSSLSKTHGLVGSFAPFWHVLMFEGRSSGFGTPDFGDMRGEVIDFGQKILYKNDLLLKLWRAPL